MVGEDLFQETKSDLFQNDYIPGRFIDESLREKFDDIAKAFGLPKRTLHTPSAFTFDVENKSPWITVVYKSIYNASRAADKLPQIGLNVYYPQTRYKEAAIQANWEMRKEKGKEVKDKWVPAFGRYLLIQLPEDQTTFENLQLDEEFLGGPFNQNCVVTILAVNGYFSLTTNDEICYNRRYHEQTNKNSNPKLNLRFEENETVRVTDGPMKGYCASCIDDVPMSYRLKTKTRIKLGRNSAIYYIKIGYLEKT